MSQFTFKDIYEGKHLSNNARLALYDAIIDYGLHSEIPKDLPAPARAMWNAIFPQLSKSGSARKSGQTHKPRQEPVKPKPEPRKKPVDKVEALLADIGEGEWKDLFRIWLVYKAEQHKKVYASAKYAKIALKKLYNMSNGNIERAREIVEYSMANMWIGFFEPKDSDIRKLDKELPDHTFLTHDNKRYYINHVGKQTFIPVDAPEMPLGGGKEYGYSSATNSWYYL